MCLYCDVCYNQESFNANKINNFLYAIPIFSYIIATYAVYSGALTASSLGIETALMTFESPSRVHSSAFQDIQAH